MLNLSLFDAPLSVGESAVLAAQEAIIERGLTTFVEVGAALLHIRDNRLYRGEFHRFEDYCQARWGMTRQHANRLVLAVEVVGNLEPIGSIPTAESQIRPLAGLPPDDQRAIWQEAVDTAPNGRVTAAYVESVVERRMAVHYSSEDLAWETPQDLFDLLDSEFGFTLDVCATAATAKCDRYFTPDDDGLAQDWRGHICWMNPPYGDEIPRWMDKAAQVAQDAVIVCLIPARTDTLWWWNHCIAGEIRFLKGRLKFRQDAGNDPTSAPFPSAAIVLGPGVAPKVVWWDWKHDLYL